MAADEGSRADRGAGANERLGDRVDPAASDGNEEGGAVERAVGNRYRVGKPRKAVDGRRVPTGDAEAPNLGFGHHGLGRYPRDHKDRQAGRMIGALDERQPRYDFRRGLEFEGRPPRSGAGDGEGVNEAEIAF